MANNDDAQILQVPLRAGGTKSDDWSSVRANDLTQLNSVLRQMQEQLFKLNGRTGDAAVRSGLSVAGAVTSGGAISGASLSLGGAGIAPSNPSFAPLVESALTPVAFDYSPVLGTTADLRIASPFTWTLSEHFLGGTNLSGSIGELGWTSVGGALATSISEANHPGFVNLDGAGTLYLTSGPVAQSDLSYIAMVIRPFAAFRSPTKLGFITVGAATVTGVGAYFYFDSQVPTWETVTRSAAGFTRNDSLLTVVEGDWVLLEIVFSSDSVDFYLNRTRLFRHQGASVAPTVTTAQLGFEQEDAGAAPNIDYDRFVAAGRGTDKIWT